MTDGLHLKFSVLAAAFKTACGSFVTCYRAVHHRGQTPAAVRNTIKLHSLTHSNYLQVREILPPLPKTRQQILGFPLRLAGNRRVMVGGKATHRQKLTGERNQCIQKKKTDCHTAHHECISPNKWQIRSLKSSFTGSNVRHRTFLH